MLTSSFSGPFGPVPLWKLILYPIGLLFLFLAIFVALQTGLASLLALTGWPTWSEGALYHLMTFLPSVVGVVVAVWVLSGLIGRRPWKDTPFGFTRWAQDTAIGFVAGMLLLSMVALVLWLTGHYTVLGWTDLGTTTVAAFLLTNLVFFLGVSVVEESLFRAGMFDIIEQWWGSAAALLVSAILFGLVHLGNEQATVIGAVAIILEAGILLGAVYMLTRRLWMVIGIHWSWNFFQGPVYGSVISGSSDTQTGLLDVTMQGSHWMTGGVFGFEASVVAIVLATGSGVWVLVRAIRTGKWKSLPERVSAEGSV